jgi:hypothetical protein
MVGAFGKATLAESPSINASVIGDYFCLDEIASVNYASTTEFLSGNILTVELSDALGSFDAPVIIGTLESAIASGNISCLIPIDQPLGNAYRVRVNSSLPAITGIDNGIDITIGCKQPVELISADITASAATLSWDAIGCAESYDIRYRESGGDWLELTTDLNTINLADLTPLTEYEWSVQAVCMTDPLLLESGYTMDAIFSTIDEGVGVLDNLLPFNFQVYPNPVSGPVQIDFDLTTPMSVQLTLFDRNGREVTILLDGPQASGKHRLNWNSGQLAAGVYTLQLIAGAEKAALEFVVE